jgi:hypothetical protein
VGKKTPGLRVDVDDDSTGRAFALVELLVLERVQNALSLLAQAFTKAHKRGVRRSTGKHKKRRNWSKDAHLVPLSSPSSSSSAPR